MATVGKPHPPEVWMANCNLEGKWSIPQAMSDIKDRSVLSGECGNDPCTSSMDPEND